MDSAFLQASPASERVFDAAEIRDRYLHRVGINQMRLVSYIPNIAPIFISTPDIPENNRANEMASLLFGNSTDEIPRQGFLVPKGSIRSSVLNLTTATLGVGTLAIPIAFANAGIILSVVLLLLQACLAYTSIKHLVSSFDVLEKYGFEEVIMMLFGGKLTVLFEFGILVFCFGSAVAYQITIADIGMAVIERISLVSGNQYSWSIFHLSREWFLCLVTLGVLLPLSLLKSLASLRFTSLLSVICVLWLVLVVFIELMYNGVHTSIASNWQTIMWPRNLQNIMTSIGIFTFAFCSQPNVPPIYADLHGKSIRRMSMAVSRSMVLCIVLYLIIGISGFVQWGSDTAVSVIINLQPYFLSGSLLVLVGYVSMAAAVCMAFPLNIFPLKLTIEQLANEFHSPHVEIVVNGSTIVIVCLSFVCAIFCPNISRIFDVIGVTAGAFICFICPAAIFLRILSLGHATFCRRSLKAWAVLLSGIMIMIVGTSSSLGLF